MNARREEGFLHREYYYEVYEINVALLFLPYLFLQMDGYQPSNKASLLHFDNRFLHKHS